MAFAYSLSEKTFRAFCKRNRLNFNSGGACVLIKQFPFSSLSFAYLEGYWIIQSMPWNKYRREFRCNSFEECLAKCIYHGLLNIQTLDKYLPWSEVLRILFSSDKTANTDFVRQYLDDFGKHISKDLHTKLSQLIHEESLCATRAFYASLRESNPRLSHVIN